MTRPHEPPYGPVRATQYSSANDRHVSWSEMIYHIDLLRDDIKDVLEEFRVQHAEWRADRNRAAATARWLIGLVATTALTVSALVIDLILRT